MIASALQSVQPRRVAAFVLGAAVLGKSRAAGG